MLTIGAATTCAATPVPKAAAAFVMRGSVRLVGLGRIGDRCARTTNCCPGRVDEPPLSSGHSNAGRRTLIGMSRPHSRR